VKAKVEIMAVLSIVLVSCSGLQQQNSTDLVALDKFIEITDPVRCEFGESLEAFYDSIFKEGPNEDIVAGEIKIPSQFDPAFKKPEYSTNRDGSVDFSIPAKGTWKGFEVVSIQSTAPAGGDPPSITIKLEADYMDVWNMLLSNGFEINGNGHSYLDDPNSVYSIGVMLSRVEKNMNQVEVTCIWY